MAFFFSEQKASELASHGSGESRSDLYLFPGMGLVLGGGTAVRHGPLNQQPYKSKK